MNFGFAGLVNLVHPCFCLTNHARFKMRKKGFNSDQSLESSLYRLDGNVIYLQGRLTLKESEQLLEDFTDTLGSNKFKEVNICLDELQDIDSSGIMTLSYLEKKLRQSGIDTIIFGGHEAVKQKIDLFSPAVTSEKVGQHTNPGFFEKIGQKVFHFFRGYVLEFLLLTADLFYWSFLDVFKANARRKGEVVNQAVLIGVNAALIVAFMSFVIGLVMSLHASHQLRTFGANIFIVDLIVIAMMSQMGPLIAAILVAGRSGSAIAAEIATMKVTSELDALKTMGLNPVRFVVAPKLYAALITMPFLVIIANAAGILGGGVAANVYLDISPEMFINRMETVVHHIDLLTGLIKSQVYASLIVITGSFYGFRVIRGAEGVGKATTASVVVAISLVILADSLLGLILY